MSLITLTPAAVAKFKEVLPPGNALRVGVMGGGCSGFQYSLSFAVLSPDEAAEAMDFDGLKVHVDQMSAMYLDGVTIDYSDGLMGGGFKFVNPNVKRTCGCGQSFDA